MTGVTSTTFTAVFFASTHPAQRDAVGLQPRSRLRQSAVLLGGIARRRGLFDRAGPHRPHYGPDMAHRPPCRLASVQVVYEAGYGPATTVAADVAPGQQTVTPASMTVGSTL